MTMERIDGARFCYPDFQPGQVLSHRDLNLLRDFTFTKSMFQNRSLIGYGVACGLRGGVQSNTRLAISAGFALAADGRELRMTAPLTIDLATIAAMAPGDFVTHPEVSDAVGGYTALIVRDDSVTAGECTDGCATEAETVCEGTRIAFARGRLSRAGVFSDPIFDRSPIVPGSDFTVSGSAFRGLRNALVAYLRPLLGGATVQLLADITLDGTPSLDLMRVGIVNEVLYATWGYARCIAKENADCFRPGTQDALALGWLHQDGSTWQWARDYRHHFELAPALYTAIFGTRGQDLCGQYLDRIRGMLESFVVPEVPADDGDDGAPTTPVGPSGPFHICDATHLYRRECWWGIEDIPPIPEIWDPWPIDPSDPLGPWFDRGPLEQWELTFPGPVIDEEVGRLDVFGSGALRLTDFIGAEGAATATAILDAISSGTSFAGDVQVVDVGAIAGIQGFKPGLVVSTADSIVLGVNSAGAIVGTGSVPATETMREAGTRIPAIERTTNEAVATAGVAAGQAAGASVDAGLALEQVGTVAGRVTTLETVTMPALLEDVVLLRGEWTDFQVGLPRVDQMTEAVASQRALLDRIGNVERDLGIQQGHIDVIDARADGIQSMFEQERVLTMDRFGSVNVRVDNAMGSGALATGAGITVQDVNRGMFDLMQSMQQAMVEAAPAANRAGVESVLAGATESMTVLEGASQNRTLMAFTQGTEFVGVMESMLTGLQEMGASATQVTDLQNQLDGMRIMLGR